MEYVIGIDSGGTKYRVQAENLRGEKLGNYVGSTASHYSFPEEQVKSRINHHIDQCLATFGESEETANIWSAEPQVLTLRKTISFKYALSKSGRIPLSYCGEE